MWPRCLSNVFWGTRFCQQSQIAWLAWVSRLCCVTSTHVAHFSSLWLLIYLPLEWWLGTFPFLVTWLVVSSFSLTLPLFHRFTFSPFLTFSPFHPSSFHPPDLTPLSLPLAPCLLVPGTLASWRHGAKPPWRPGSWPPWHPGAPHPRTLELRCRATLAPGFHPPGSSTPFTTCRGVLPACHACDPGTCSPLPSGPLPLFDDLERLLTYCHVFPASGQALSI